SSHAALARQAVARPPRSPVRRVGFMGRHTPPPRSSLGRAARCCRNRGAGQALRAGDDRAAARAGSVVPLSEVTAVRHGTERPPGPYHRASPYLRGAGTQPTAPPYQTYRVITARYSALSPSTGVMTVSSFVPSMRLV